MSRCYLGVDIGGSKSHALLCDENGLVLGFARAGAGNHEQIGYDGLRHVLETMLHEALTRANLTPADIAGAGFGLCGYDWPSEYAAHQAVIEQLPFRAPYEIVNDSVIGLVAGAQDSVGVCVIAGTSCNACGRAADGRHGQMIGMGQMLGEAGGSDELVTRALWAIAYEYTRRGPPTRLTPAFVSAVGATSVAQLLEDYTEQRVRVGASFAPLVFEVARAGDVIAQDLLRWTGRELGELAKAIMRQLDFGAVPFDLVLAGRYFQGSPLILESLRESIAEHTTAARLVTLAAPPVIGGALLGMERGGLARAAVNAARLRLQTYQTDAVADATS